MWFPSLVVSREPPTSCTAVRHHLQHHGVGGRDESPGPERPTAPAQLLHGVGVAVVHIQVVIATGGVGLQVKHAEGKHDNVALGDLGIMGCRREGAKSQRLCYTILFFLSLFYFYRDSAH